jgi:phosphopentomutase
MTSPHSKLNEPGFERVCVIVLDSVGIGELPDSSAFGDEGSHTLGHICEAVPTIRLPNLQQLGLGNIAPLSRVAPCVVPPDAYYGKMAEISSGKDTMTGHWELMGLKTEIPFRVFPDGFPQELLDKFSDETGRGILGNVPASGTAIIEQYGAEQMRIGAWIVYTSADSVIQIAAHEDVIPLAELYKACELMREWTRREPYAIGRVIARPYRGEPGRFERTASRHDYALAPSAPTVLDRLAGAGWDVIAVGKINDIFSGQGVTETYPTKSNAHGIQTTIEQLDRSFHGLLFVNLVDFDSLYGHRRDPQGYAACLEQFDQSLPELTRRIGERDLLVITADHGNDPTFAGTDHTREFVPLLVYHPSFVGNGQSTGVRSTYADLAATIADNFKVPAPDYGTSFLQQLLLQEPQE